MISTTFVLFKAHSFCIANELVKGEMVSRFCAFTKQIRSNSTPTTEGVWHKKLDCRNLTRILSPTLTLIALVSHYMTIQPKNFPITDYQKLILSLQYREKVLQTLTNYSSYQRLAITALKSSKIIYKHKHICTGREVVLALSHVIFTCFLKTPQNIFLFSLPRYAFT